MAEQVWYPLWDAGADLDHSVRALSEVTGTAEADPRVALGLLDARHVAGDPSVTLRLRADLLAHWRRDARGQLPALRELVTGAVRSRASSRTPRCPNLKESVGGLRDATVLKALVATWLVDVSHSDLEPSRLQLLDVRDAVQGGSGPRDRPRRPGAVARPGRGARAGRTRSRRSGRSARSVGGSPT